MLSPFVAAKRDRKEWNVSRAIGEGRRGRGWVTGADSNRADEVYGEGILAFLIVRVDVRGGSGDYGSALFVDVTEVTAPVSQDLSNHGLRFPGTGHPSSALS